jgi:hypothetical protein
VSYVSQYTGESFGYEEERDGYDMCYEQMQREEYERAQALSAYEEECARQPAKEDV